MMSVKTEEKKQTMLVYEVSEEDYREQRQEEEPIGDLTFMEFNSINEMIEELAYQGFDKATIVTLSNNRYGNVIEINHFTTADGSSQIGIAIGAR